MKKFLTLLVALAMVLSLASCGAQGGGEAGGVKSEGDTIKIGWIGCLTGDQAVFGTAESQTIQMWVEKQNEAGGILGKKLELVKYDTRGDVAEAVNAVTKLCAQDKVVGILGPNASDQAIGISGVLEKYQVPDIATVATNPKVTQADDGSVKPYNFRVCFTDPYEGGVAASYASKKLGFTKAAILYDVASDYSQGMTQYFEETFLANGGQIVAKEGFKSGDTDFRAQLTKIKDSGAECIFMPYFYKEVALSANQARQLGVEAVFIGGDGWQSAQLFTMAKDAVQGSYVVNHIDFNDPEVQPFGEEYSARWDGAKPELNTYLGADAFNLLMKAIEKAGEADSDKIAKAIPEVELKGITGNIKISPETHNPEGKEAVLTKIEDEQYTFLERFSAQ